MIALRRRGLAFGSPPPVFAARVISFDNLLKILPRFASIAPLKRLTFDHLLCPAIGVRSYLNLKTYEQCSPRERNDLRGEKFTAPIIRTKNYPVNRAAEYARDNAKESVAGHREPVRKPVYTRVDVPLRVDW